MSNEVSFVVDQAALDIIKNTHISANFEECKVALIEMIQPYRGMVISEEDIVSAKNDRAKIRKVAQRIDDARKAVKAVYNAPLKIFEADCKELAEICIEGANNLDRQIKDFERRDTELKIAELRDCYEQAVTEESMEFCPWEFVYNAKWENKTYPVERAKEEIHEALMQTEKDIESIRTMGGTDSAYLLGYYMETHDIGAVIRKSADLKTARSREEQRRRDAEEKKQEAEAEFARMREEEERRKQAVTDAEYSPAVTTELPPEDLVTVTFKVVCTKKQLAALGKYMQENGIKYGRA